MVGGKNRLVPRGALLVVGDVDPALGLEALSEWGYAVDAVANPKQALARTGEYGVVLIDFAASSACSLSHVSPLKRVYPDARLIVLDDEGSIKAAVAAIKAGAWDYLHRPIAPAALCDRIEQALAPAADPTQRHGDPIVVYISQHATAISSRGEVASRFGLSLDTVSSRVRAVTGQTFIEFLHLCRLDLARQLLAATELNVSQVAARVGFSTPQHFSRVFRKHAGISPARYRLQARARENAGD